MKKINLFITGQNGMVGSALVRRFDKKKFNIIKSSRKTLNLLNQNQVDNWFKKNKPDIVIHAAGKVGGIMHNSTYPANFIYENAQMALNVIHSSFKNKVKFLINLGSACIYPKLSKQPIKEEYLLNGKLEPTNEAYAIAKILGLKMTEYYNKQYKCKFLSLQPTNLYGLNDNFNPISSHVIPGMINKFSEAKKTKKKFVKIWGSGKPKREFLYVDDLADAIFFIIKNKKKFFKYNLINVGSGNGISIKELSLLIKKITNFDGKIVFDKDKPDGTPRKIVSTKILKDLGWSHKTSLEQGLKKTYKFFNKKYDNK